MKRISILGSTGSIGTQALDIIEHNREELCVAALSCAKRLDLLREQIRRFVPAAVCVAREEDAKALQREFPRTEVYHGMAGLTAIASMQECDMVLNSLLGMQGLEPTLAAAKAGKSIAFANKETLVAGGQLVMDTVRRNRVDLLPVDSEHSAIFQSLQGAGICGPEGETRKGNGQRPEGGDAACGFYNPIRRILLTASGGPFRGYTKEQLREVTLQQALRHPNWSMGAKITIDSATMMNKGLEVIEARWLFDVPLEKIQVVVHPQSVLHSAVEFEDGSVIGQMGNPDMRVPIAYAFSYPKRLPMSGSMEPLDIFSFPGGLTFERADEEVFRTIGLAYEACRRGGTYPVCLNAANEVLVAAFLQERIRFIQIQEMLEDILQMHQPLHDLSLEEILETDQRVRAQTEERIRRTS